MSTANPTVVVAAVAAATVMSPTTTSVPLVADLVSPEPPTPLPSTSTASFPSPTPTVLAVTATAEPSPTAAALTLAIAKTALSLRSGPGQSFGIVQTLGPGETVTALSKLPAGDWWLVRTASGLNGWALANLLALSSPDASLPVAASKPTPTMAPSPSAGPQPVATSPPLTSATAVVPTAPTATPSGVTIAATHGGHVSAIGDSVMLGAAPELRLVLGDDDVDAAVSRQVSTAIGILSARRSTGQLGGIVVVHLGTNGTFTAGQFDQIMHILAGERRVVFVNVHAARSWEAGDNAVLAAGVTRYGNTRLVDWHGASAGQFAFFAGDGIHMRPDGAAVYAHLIAGAIDGG